MLLRSGELDGKQILLEAAVREMSRRQTSAHLKQSYGLECTVNNGVFGHGGALATDLMIDLQHGLVMVWLVQHAGFPHEGAKAKDAFRSAALVMFGQP